jgi:hypothetical protein
MFMKTVNNIQDPVLKRKVDTYLTDDKQLDEKVTRY